MAPWLEFVAYEYDGLDQRIRKTVTIPGQSNPTVQERYLYDRNVLDPSMSDVLLVINELATGSTWQKVTHRFMNGPQIDQVFSDETNGGILWYLQDRQNTVRDVATWDGHGDATKEWKDVNHISYDTFGNVIGFDDPTTDGTDTHGKPGTDTTNAPRRSYTGREPDQHTGLIYYRARWFDAKLGRFISEDPIGFAAGDANLSRMVRNSMPNAVDPSGMEEDSGYDEAPTGYWNGVGRVFGGYWGAAKSTVGGVYTLGRHPIDSAKGIGSAIAHPIDTTKAICNDVYNKSGSLEGQGELVGDVLIGVLTGGSVKAAKEAARLQKIARLAKAAEKASEAADTAADLQKVAKALDKVKDAVDAAAQSKRAVNQALTPEIPKVATGALSQGERLAEFNKRLTNAPCAKNAQEAFEQMNRTLDEVEDAYSGVAKAQNPGLKYDGRMYPPRADYTTRLPNGGLEAITKGNVIRIGPDGSIRIFLRNADGSLGAQLLEKLGAGL